MLTRRRLAAAMALAALPLPARAEPRSLRIGYQKNGILVVARQRGTIEAKLAPLGVQVDWLEFSHGPPLMEALRLGAVSVGQVGDAPVIFAQAAGSDVLYVAAQPATGSASAILVPPGSTLQTLADLRGRRVAFAKGSSAHSLTLAALERAGLAYSDIVPAYLAPADAAAAFARGSVDAWTIWDPYYAIAEEQAGVRALAKSDAIAPQTNFFVGSKAYTLANPDVVTAFADSLAETAAWSRANRDETARLLSDGTGVGLPQMQRVVARSDFTVAPMTDDVLAEQQRVADRFAAAGLLPRPVRVADIAWRAGRDHA